MIWNALDKYRDVGLLIVRLGIGLGFVYFHGWDKLSDGPARWAEVGGTMNIFGIGFGREFTEYGALPRMDWWALQFMTPHNDVLWLWLKMGIAGVGVMLGVWILAFKRCLLAFKASPRASPPPLAPLIVAAALVSFLAFAQFDLVLPGARSGMPFAAVLAAAFALPQPLPGTRERG